MIKHEIKLYVEALVNTLIHHNSVCLLPSRIFDTLHCTPASLMHLHILPAWGIKAVLPN